MKCNVMESEIREVMLALIFNAKLIIHHYQMNIEWNKRFTDFASAARSYSFMVHKR